ncbi:hypothetical protein JL722_5566 [Aureococcus anophagefferens]|nr:hypothetical protein JL722_5566 [Aureococcus anophagefferens]
MGFARSAGDCSVRWMRAVRGVALAAACCRAFVLPTKPRHPSLSRAAARDAPENDVYDVVICGAGPSGLSLASACARRDLSVCVVDPALDEPWPNNYGVWIDEVEPLGYGDCCDAVWRESSVVFEDAGAGDLANVTLRRPYGRVDRIALKRRLVDECGPSTVFVSAGARRVDHRDDAPSEVSLDGGSSPTALLDVPGGHPFPLDKLVLMDYRDGYLGDDAAAVKRNERFPSFMYVMPLSERKIFFEETILASRGAGKE